MEKEKLTLTIKTLISYGEFDSLLKYDGKYYVCFKKLGKEKEISETEFLLLEKYGELPMVDADA